MPVVYRHIRLDKNEPFYIGIGRNIKRAYETKTRNDLWKKIVSKSDYEVQILIDGLTWEQACVKEKEFIKLYGRKDIGTGILANMTDGGEGNQNFSLEVRQKISRANKGNKYGLGWNPNAEQRKKMSEANLGKPNNSKTKFIKGFTPWNKGTKGLCKKNITTISKDKPLKAISLIDIKTGQIFKTIRDAATFNNINEKSLYSMLRGRYKNKTNLRYASIQMQ